MKRIVAIVLSDLACELARLSGMVHDDPFAVIVDDDEEPPDEPVKPSAVLHAVDPRAWQYGARPGQKAAQAAAFVGKLQIVRLPRGRVLEALGAVAEVALAFGTTAGFDLRCDEGKLRGPKGKRDREAATRYPAGLGAGPYDTVWLDVTGCSRLVGGDDILCAELREKVSRLGHNARVAIADGPRIAQAAARWSRSSETVIPAGKGAEQLAPLPVAALPLSPERLSWLGKLGILHIGDLATLDRKRLAPRLGREAVDLIALVAGHDDVPVVAYERPRCIVEQASFDHEIDGLEPIFFILRGLTGRAIARLRGRGEACSLVSIVLEYDRAILRLAERNDGLSDALADQLAERHETRGDETSQSEPHAETAQLVTLELPVPLANEAELLRALRAKLDRLELPAPIRAVRLTLDGLSAQRHHQLAIGKKAQRDPHALPTLLAELGAWLGSDRVGVLDVVHAHRPEARSRLVPCDFEAPPPVAALRARVISPMASEADIVDQAAPTRMLPEPLEIARADSFSAATRLPIRPGSLIAAEHHLFILDRVRLAFRLDAVEWWTKSPLSRDYLQAWMHGSSPGASPASSHTEHAEASLYVTRGAQPRVFLQGWFD